MSSPTILTVMPDYGMGPFLWLKRDGEEGAGLGGNCCSYESACSFHPMSQELLRAFSDWVAEFGRAGTIRRGRRDDLDLTTHKVADSAEIARVEGIDRARVTKVTKLALLAPDVIAAIVEGRLPVTLHRLMRQDVPSDWDTQRTELGAQSPS